MLDKNISPLISKTSLNSHKVKVMPKTPPARSILLSAAIVLLFTSLACVPAIADERLIEIDRAIFAKEIIDKQPVYFYIAGDPSPRRNKPLVFWTRVVGKSDAYARLKKKGKLPIRHEWYWYVGGRAIASNEFVTQEVSSEDFFKVDSINLPITAAAADSPLKEFTLKSPLGKLQYELNHDGTFDWRVWSEKRRLKRGVWRVKVVYEDNTPVLCGAQGVESRYRAAL
jgi:hypothetical protein